MMTSILVSVSLIALQNLDAIHLAHFDVEQDDVRRGVVEHLEGIRAIDRSLHLIF